MQRELRTLWRALRRHDDVRAVVLTGAGDRAFCTGIDRNEALGDASPDATTGEDGESVHVGAGTTPFLFDDPGEDLGPKTCDLWKPVIAAVNGIACGGAFYLLGEVDFIIATEAATFFDPHVTYGMAAAFEPLQMSGSMPFGELARLTLLGASERMSAARAHQIGLVSELPSDVADLRDRAKWARRRTTVGRPGFAPGAVGGPRPQPGSSPGPRLRLRGSGQQRGVPGRRPTGLRVRSPAGVATALGAPGGGAPGGSGQTTGAAPATGGNPW